MQMGIYKNRTEKDAKIYLSEVFGVKSIKDLSKNREVLKTIEENVKEECVLDVLVYTLYIKYCLVHGNYTERLAAKWFPQLGWNMSDSPVRMETEAI